MRPEGLALGLFRTVDILTRYGGDELVIVMPQTDITGAEIVGKRLRAEVEWGTPFTVSVGVASASDADTPESLFQRADAAMYRAKNGGRNRVFCDPGETSDAVLQEAKHEIAPCRISGCNKSTLSATS